MASLVLEFGLNSKSVEVHGYDAHKKRWEVKEPGAERCEVRVKAGSLSLRVSERPKIQVSTLDGRTVSLLAYQALESCFAVECDGERMELPAASLRDASGSPLQPPVQVMDGPASTGQQLVRARWRFSPGQVIFEEAPSLFMNGVCSDIYAMSKVLDRFFALPQADRTRILALHPSDAIHLKHGQQCAAPTLAYADHTVDRSSVEASTLLGLLKQDGYCVPEGEEAVAEKFLLVWDANAFDSDTGRVIYVILSRVNHSCAPNALRVQHGGRICLVALREIEPGEEVTQSYLNQDMLLEPRAMRQRRLTSWFPSCWCLRCASEWDDVRCFPCATKTCTDSACTALSSAGIAGCNVCGAVPTNSASLLRMEQQIVDKYLAFERCPETLTEKGIDGLLQLASRVLAPRHWVRAALGDVAQDACTQIGAHCTDRPSSERVAAFERAVALTEDWCASWRANLQVSAACVALKRERAGDILTVLGRFPESIQQYLMARSELASLAVPSRPDGSGRVERIERKLRAALNGESNDHDLR